LNTAVEERAVAMARTNSNKGSDSKRMTRSFGENRICAAPECRTRLSRYNPDDWCFTHRDQAPRHPVDRGRL
jgi:hypothetical protein